MSLLHFFPLKDLEVVAAAGTELTLADGRTVLDMGGASHGAAIVGHSHPRVVDAVREQIGKVAHVAHLYPNPARSAFLAALAQRLPGFDRFFLANSGTEAVEAALKFAAAATGRSRFVAARNGFHGRTLGALSVTHKPAYRDPVAGIAAPCDFVAYDDADALADAITDHVAAVVLEVVQGEGGVVPASSAYLRAARDLCDDHGAKLILDEVQTGMHRTGPFLAAEGHGVRADITSLGKGLAGGVPVGVTAVTDAVADALPAGFHGSTYGGSPIQCAAGAAALQVCTDEGLAKRAAAMGTVFADLLRAIDHVAITEVRQIGLMVNVDLRIRAGDVLAGLEQHGILALAGGARGVRFLPPLTVPEDALRQTADALADALP